jgi:SAM-dependent methyltransferase
MGQASHHQEVRVKAIDLVHKYAGPRVLILGEVDRLLHPEWMNPRKETAEKPKDTLDLNGSEIRYRGQTKDTYDLVVDSGALEHELDIYGALKKMSRAVKKGGVIFHLSPMSMINWGYWNINPKAFKEFYKDWEILEQWAVKKEHSVPLPHDRASIASEVSMIFVARK